MQKYAQDAKKNMQNFYRKYAEYAKICPTNMQKYAKIMQKI